MSTTDESLRPYPRVFPGPANNAAGAGRNYETSFIHEATFTDVGLNFSDYEWTPGNIFNVVVFTQDVPIGRPHMPFDFSGDLFFGATQIAASSGAAIRTTSDFLTWLGTVQPGSAPGSISATVDPTPGAPGVFTLNGVENVQGYLFGGVVPDFGWTSSDGGAVSLPYAFLTVPTEGAVMHGKQWFATDRGLPLAGAQFATQIIVNVADYTEAIRADGNRIVDYGNNLFDTDAVIVGVYEEIPPAP